LKKIFYIFFIIAAVISAQALVAFAEQGGLDSKVVAYYFHGTMRCPTCHKLEQYSQEAIETNFKEALASGKFEFKAINVEGKGNEHYVKDYQLYSKSLVLSLIKDGKDLGIRRQQAEIY
jgi:hypothetical protein